MAEHIAEAVKEQINNGVYVMCLAVEQAIKFDGGIEVFSGLMK